MTWAGVDSLILTKEGDDIEGLEQPKTIMCMYALVVVVSDGCCF